VKAKRTIITGIESTARLLQPFNVWREGKVIFFAKTLKEAETVLAGK